MTPLTPEQKQEALKWGVVPEDDTETRPTSTSTPTTTPANTTPPPVPVVNPTDAQLQQAALQYGQTGSAAPVTTKTTPETTTKPTDQPITPEMDAATKIKELEDQAKKADDLLNNKNLPQHIAENVMQNQQEIIRERDAALAKATLLQSYQDAGEKVPDEVKALMSGELAFYLKTEDGKLQIDVVKAVEAGVSREALQTAGVSAMDIAVIKRNLRNEKKWLEVNQQVTEYYEQKQKEFERNSVKLGDGSYMSMKDYRDLEQSAPEYARIALEQGYDSMVRKMNDDAGIVPPPSLEEIRSAQKAYFEKKRWDIEDKTNPDYSKRILEATRKYSDSIGYTRLKAEIDAETRAERSATLKESVMQLVPFEYLRSNRWNSLATWEKVVYPVMDVATLIPVVGWAGKGATAALKAGSAGAKVVALGGKEVIDIALKEAVTGLDKAAGVSLEKHILSIQAKETLQTALKAGKINIAVYQRTLKTAAKEITLVHKELTQIRQNVETLQKLSSLAAKTEGKAGAKAFTTASKVARFGSETVKVGRIGTTVEKAADIAGAGVGTAIVSHVTIRNWNELTPAQRVAGIGMAALTLGIVSPTVKGTVNAGENIANPFKIPKSAAATRRTNSKQIVGQIWAEEGGKSGGTTRMVIDETLGPEKAREAMEKGLREQNVTGADVVLDYGTHQPVMKGTGFQGIVGGNVSFSATPMGDIFKTGTGAYGKKTLLEQELEKINRKLPESDRIEIEAKLYNNVKTISKPGVTIAGKEGGQYVSQTLYTKFSHQAAFGAKGSMPAGLVIFTPGIDKLPKKISRMDIKAMEKAAVKEFDGTKEVGKQLPGFKQYKIFIEAENVITNGTQEYNVRNLRSKIADKLKQNKAEYFTRDDNGKVELLQMYIEGGRATPLTLEKIYTLKGRALRNALEDMAFGLGEKLKALKRAPKRTVTIQEVDQRLLDSSMKKGETAGVDTRTVKKMVADGDIDGALSKFDEAAGKTSSLSPEEIKRLKSDIARSRKTVKIKSPEHLDTLTKEEQIGAEIQKLEDAYKAGEISADELTRGRSITRYLVEEEYRRAAMAIRSGTIERVMGQRLAKTARENLERRDEQDYRNGNLRTNRRTVQEGIRVKEPKRTENIRQEYENRLDTPRGDNRLVEEPRVERPESPRVDEPPRTNEPPRTEEPPRTSEPPRVEEPPRTDIPPRIKPPRIDTDQPPRKDEPPYEETPRSEPILSKTRPSPAQIGKATSSWPQGMGWWVVYRGSDGNLYKWFSHGQRPPKGVRNVRQGEGEAARGIQQPAGNLTEEFDFPMGVTSARITKPGKTPGRAGAIAFLPASRTRLPGSRTRITPSARKRRR